jgi:hypothetical protein
VHTEGDRLLLAWVQGVVDCRVRYRELTAQERADAVAEIHTVTTRPELLAEVAGIRRGMAPYKVPPQEAERYRRQAELLIEAGADEMLVPQWTAVGRKRGERRQAARLS